jgi:hypothetical protein
VRTVDDGPCPATAGGGADVPFNSPEGTRHYPGAAGEVRFIGLAYLLRRMYGRQRQPVVFGLLGRMQPSSACSSIGRPVIQVLQCGCNPLVAVINARTLPWSSLRPTPVRVR